MKLKNPFHVHYRLTLLRNREYEHYIFKRKRDAMSLVKDIQGHKTPSLPYGWSLYKTGPFLLPEREIKRGNF